MKKKLFSKILSVVLCLALVVSFIPFYSLTTVATTVAEDDGFDENNIILKFGVVSDTHVSGGSSTGTNQKRSRAKFVHMLDVFNNLGADALLVNGDFVDALASPGQVNGTGLTDGSASDYGTKADQNFKEVSSVAKALWGTLEGDDGVGLGDMQLFYSLGNHDEHGMGKYEGASTTNAAGETVYYSDVYSADYMAAVFCGWQYDNTSEAALASTDGFDNSYRDFIATLLDHHINKTEVDAESFSEKYGVSFEDAYAKFVKYYGNDSDYSFKDQVEYNEDYDATVASDTYNYGLRYGNRHMTMDGGDANSTADDIHFIAIELSQSTASLAWAKTILDKSVEENPDKPVFIISHYKTANTKVFGSQPDVDGLALDALDTMLKNYPQAVIWGGHDHNYLHSDASIDTTNGYTSIESSTTQYSSNAALTLGRIFGTNSASSNRRPYNAQTTGDYAFSNGCFVEVDGNFNVRVRRIDLYRSYSADYAQNTDLYSHDIFTDYATQSKGEAVDTVVEIRDPWILTGDISEGAHLSAFTTSADGRWTNSSAPTIPEGALSVTGNGIRSVPVEFKMNATDDGLVYVYAIELWNGDATELVERYYYTNKFYYYPDAQVPDETVNYTFTGLEPATNYTVKLLAADEFGNISEPLSATVTTASGNEKITLDDGRTGVFVDTTAAATYAYEYEGAEYAVYTDFVSALSEAPDVVYYIAGDTDVGDVLDNIPSSVTDLEIIGINRDNAILSYSGGHVFDKCNLTLKNISLDKSGTGDQALVFSNLKTLTLDSVKASLNSLNFFAGESKSYNVPGSLVIKGDTGTVSAIFTTNYGANENTDRSIDGDINITIDGGTFSRRGGDGEIFTHKSSLAGVNGNMFVTISGGTFETNVALGKTEAASVIHKNAVLRLNGGTFASVGATGTTYVDGKDVIIAKKSVYDSTETFNKADNAILITYDDVGGIGDATYDENGYITGFAVTQVSGYTSKVNGVEATSFDVANGETYTVTYEKDVTVAFNSNGGTGTMGSVTIKAGEYTLPENGFTAPEGYHFIGWATAADGEVISTDTIDVTEDTTLYAKWASHTVYIGTTTGDSPDGTESNPYASVDAAIQAVNAAIEAGTFDLGEDNSLNIVALDGAVWGATATTAHTYSIVVKSADPESPVTINDQTSSNLALGGNTTFEDIIFTVGSSISKCRFYLMGNNFTLGEGASLTCYRFYTGQGNSTSMSIEGQTVIINGSLVLGQRIVIGSEGKAVTYTDYLNLIINDSNNKHTVHLYHGNTTHAKTRINVKDSKGVTFTSDAAAIFTNGSLQIINSTGTAIETNAFDTCTDITNLWIVNNNSTTRKEALNFSDTVGKFTVGSKYNVTATNSDATKTVPTTQENGKKVLNLVNAGAGAYTVTVAAEETYYVGKTTSETPDGTKANPYASVVDAIAAVNAAITNGTLDLAEGDTLTLLALEGTTWGGAEAEAHTYTLSLKSADPENPVTINDRSNAAIRLSGTTIIDDITIDNSYNGSSSRFFLKGNNFTLGEGACINARRLYTGRNNDSDAASSVDSQTVIINGSLYSYQGLYIGAESISFTYNSRLEIVLNDPNNSHKITLYGSKTTNHADTILDIKNSKGITFSPYNSVAVFTDGSLQIINSTGTDITVDASDTTSPFYGIANLWVINNQTGIESLVSATDTAGTFSLAVPGTHKITVTDSASATTDYAGGTHTATLVKGASTVTVAALVSDANGIEGLDIRDLVYAAEVLGESKAAEETIDTVRKEILGVTDTETADSGDSTAETVTLSAVDATDKTRLLALACDRKQTEFIM